VTLAVTILLAVASLASIGNVAGVLAARLRRGRRGAGGFSSVPFVSLASCSLAWLLSHDGSPRLLLPALLDPANWSLVALPFFLLFRPRAHGDGRGSPVARVVPPLESREEGGGLVVLLDEPALHFFASPEEAERSIEPIDAESEVRAAFDAAGFPYRVEWIRTNRSRTVLGGILELTRQGDYRFVAAGPADPDALVRLLESHPHAPDCASELASLLARLRTS